jgi:DNA-binding transcriptional MocR family regulator
MSIEMAARSLDEDLLARELGNWRTSSATGPAYAGLADAIRLLIVDGRVPVGARLPSERALADALRVSRTTVTAAFTQLREDGYLQARRGARSTAALPPRPEIATEPATGAAVSLAAAALSAPSAPVLEAFAAATRDITPYLSEPGHDLTGVCALRTAVAQRYCDRGLPTEPGQIMITSGAQHAIGLILAAFTEPGDRVLVEQPTYHGALSAISTAGTRAVPVPLTDDGWELDAVHAALRQLSPSLAYLIPDNHNPTGFTMSPDERIRLGHIISETRTRTVIDESIMDMWIDQAPPAPLAASVPRHDLVLTVGSMSKSFWGGLRVGWIRAERNTLATIAAIRPSVDLGTPILEQLTAARLIEERDAVLAERRALLRSRRAYLLNLLERRLPDWRPGSGPNGMSLWVKLPAPMSTALSASASRLGLDLPAGPRFGVDGTLERFVRVPYALPEPQLEEAVDLMARAWAAITGAPEPESHAVVV